MKSQANKILLNYLNGKDAIFPHTIAKMKKITYLSLIRIEISIVSKGALKNERLFLILTNTALF